MNFVSLDLQGSDVTDLDIVSRLPGLKRLNISGTPITNLRPLEGMQLERLIFTPSRITEGLEFVRNMPTLRELDIEFEGRAPVRSPSTFWAAYDAGEFKSASAK